MSASGYRDLMATLRFILGRAGSGKSTHMLEALAEDLARGPTGSRLLLIVPEQATFQAESALLDTIWQTSGGRGFARADVLSFQRLAWRVLHEVGTPVLPAIGELGQWMVLRALIEAETGRLRLFHRLVDRPGFLRCLAASLGELRDFGHLARVAGGLEPAGAGAADEILAAKMHDLGIIAARYNAFLGERFTDPRDILRVVASGLAMSSRVDGAKVYVDGFTGFTPPQFAVLEALLHRVGSMEVALCLDAGELAQGPPAQEALFHPTRSTHAELMARAQAVGAIIAPPLLLPQGTALPRFRCAALARVEAAYFSPDPLAVQGSANGVQLVLAASRRLEVEACAREILRLCRDEGLRFREIAILVRDLDAYRDLGHVLAAHGVAAFIDARRPVGHHPLVELVRSALETMLQRWNAEPFLRCLKTDLLPLKRDEADELETYILEFGITGARLRSMRPWRFRRQSMLEEATPREGDQARLERINRSHARAAGPLARFASRVAAARLRARPVTMITDALEALLEELEVDATIRAWSEEAEREGNLSLAQEHLQVLGGVMQLLDETVLGLEELELTLEQYRQVLEAGLDSLRVGLVPPGMDEVVVGSVERSRHRGVRALLVLGATDQAFPHRAAEDVLLDDADRQALGAAGLELGPTSHQRMLHERYLLYVTLTRASDFLWIACPLADGEGRAQTPSPLFERLCTITPGLVPRRVAQDDPMEMATEDAVTAAVTLRLREGAEHARARADDLALATWVAGQGRHRERARRVLAALQYENRPEWLDPALARSLYGDPLVSSVSRLESFARCAFQHFGLHGLRLEDRARQRLDAAGVGQLVHAVLHRVAEAMDQAGVAWKDLSRERAAVFVDAAMNELAPRLQNEILATSARYRFVELNVRRTLLSLLLRLAAHAGAGTFIPVGAEVPFGPRHADAPVVRLTDGTGLHLSGRIDRIEASQAGERRLVRVVDFKLRPRALGLEWVYHGLALQLGIYLQVALAHEARLHPDQMVTPAGLLYLPVTDAWVRVDGPVTPEEAHRRRAGVLRANGWVLDDPEAIRAMDQSGSGQLIPVRLRLNGRPHASSRVLTGAQLRGLTTHVTQTVTALAQGIVQGDTRALPYRLGDDTPCASCPLHGVCRFDASLDPQRRLAAPDRDAVLAYFAARDGERGVSGA